MSNKSTPGPWVLAGGDTVIVRSKGGYRIAEVDYDYPGYKAGIDFEEAVANARLIAAAPDLLQALRNLVDIQERDERGDPDYLATDEWREEALMIAKSAIAKAEEES